MVDEGPHLAALRAYKVALCAVGQLVARKLPSVHKGAAAAREVTQEALLPMHMHVLLEGCGGGKHLQSTTHAEFSFRTAASA
jgi:hypothetical protein